jgi:hypothetical protein
MVAAEGARPLDDVAALSLESERRQQARTFIRYTLAEAAAAQTHAEPMGVFAARHPRSVHLDSLRRSLDLVTRAPVPGGGGWATPLRQTPFSLAFASKVFATTALGKIPGALALPVNTRAPYPTTPAQAAWVTLGKAIPVSSAAFNSIQLDPYLLASIVIATMEVVSGTGPEVEAVFEALLTNAANTAVDTALLDPNAAGVPGESPPSLTHGAFSVPSSGSSLAALNADLGKVADNMLAQGVRLTKPVVIMSPASALRAGGLSLPGGGFTIPTVLTPGAGNSVVLIDADLLAYTNAGMEVVQARAASVELSDAPIGDLNAPTAASMVSLWASNSVGFKLTQYLNWQAADPAAVAVVAGFGATP